MIPNEEMKKLRAFFGDPAVKAKFVARVKAHQEADEIVQGKYWQNGKGCAVGCTVEDSNSTPGIHKRYEEQTGIPESIAMVEDAFFEMMTNEDAKQFPLRFLESIPVGADLSLVPAKLIIYMLDSLKDIKEVKEDAKVGSAISDTIVLWRRVVAGDIPDKAAWSAAESAAWSAAESAAESAAWSAAWSAAESAARSAAWSAAESAAESAAWSAAWSAARSAARSAAESAAESAAGKKYGDALIELCKQAPVVK